jgi:hypothetical protein
MNSAAFYDINALLSPTYPHSPTTGIKQMQQILYVCGFSYISYTTGLITPRRAVLIAAKPSSRELFRKNVFELPSMQYVFF